MDQVKTGDFRGIVFVVAYGHNSIADFSFKKHKLYSKEEGLEDFVVKYTESCRKEEEKILGKICDAVRACGQPIWIMTLVTKQDLWWNEREAVENHYSTGKYRNIVAKSAGGKESHEFRHETVFVSLVIRNLMTGRNEVLKMTVAGYDQAHQRNSIENLLHTFEGLMDWETQNGN